MQKFKKHTSQASFLSQQKSGMVSVPAGRGRSAFIFLLNCVQDISGHRLNVCIRDWPYSRGEEANFEFTNHNKSSSFCLRNWQPMVRSESNGYRIKDTNYCRSKWLACTPNSTWKPLYIRIQWANRNTTLFLWSMTISHFQAFFEGSWGWPLVKTGLEEKFSVDWTLVAPILDPGVNLWCSRAHVWFSFGFFWFCIFFFYKFCLFCSVLLLRCVCRANVSLALMHNWARMVQAQVSPFLLKNHSFTIKNCVLCNNSDLKKCIKP